MAYIKQKSERKFKITVCNGYKVNGQKRMKAQTITVPTEVPKRGIQQYVMAEAERIEKKFKYGIEESDQTHFDRYAEAWLNRQKPYFKATTLAGYKRNLEIVCPFIGGIPLAKIRPLTLEEMCEELRKRPGRNGSVKECTVQKYLETVSSVLEDAKKNVAEVETDATTEADTDQQSGLSGLFSKVKDSIGSAASGTLEKFKQTLNDLIEALAILLVTSCLIPILVILLFLWLFKLIIGIDIPLPALKAEKRNTEQTNQEQ